MKLKKWLPYIVSVGIALGVGALSALLSKNGMEIYQENAEKPPFTPPGWLFSVVWTVLYVFMGISAARIWLLPDSSLRSKALNRYVAQLVLNFFWSLIFFNLQAYGFAFIWLLALWILVFTLVRAFYKLDRTAAFLQIPYLVWLTFAAYLNIGVWALNG